MHIIYLAFDTRFIIYTFCLTIISHNYTLEEYIPTVLPLSPFVDCSKTHTHSCYMIYVVPSFYSLALLLRLFFFSDCFSSSLALGLFLFARSFPFFRSRLNEIPKPMTILIRINVMELIAGNEFIRTQEKCV